MKKRNSLIFVIGLLVCVLSILAQNSHAQKKAAVKSDETQKSTKKSVLQQYIDFSALPMNQRGKTFNDLSAEEKASLFRFHLAFQLANRQNLTQAQKDQILDAMLLATPEIYGSDSKKRISAQQQLEVFVQKAKILFTGQEVFEIFGSVGAKPKDLEKLQKYENFSPYDFESRRQMFKDSTVIERADAWDIHCAVFLAERPELHAYQQAFVVELFDFINAELFDIRADNPKWESMVGKPIAELLKRAQPLFAKEQIITLFSQLGGSRGTSSLRSPESPTDDCQCHRGTGDLCAYDCAGTNCTVWSVGCGVLWLQSCNGVACNEIPILT